MTVLATSGIAGLLPFLLVVACPLMMVFMMRGMHSKSGNAHAAPKRHEQMSMDELKHARDELNEEIGNRAEQIVHARGSRREAPR